MVSLGFGLKKAKTLFFKKGDWKRIKNSEMAVLGRYGAYVRRTARQSIRKRKGKTPRGKPPADRTGLLRKTILFVKDYARDSVVIGPWKFETQSAPGLAYLEENFPFMGPANEKNLPKLAGMWKDSIR